jgi:hypothetical protein
MRVLRYELNNSNDNNFLIKFNILLEKAFFTKYDLAKHILTHTKQKGKLEININ